MECFDALRDKIKRGDLGDQGPVLCVIPLADTSPRVANSEAMIGYHSNGSRKVCFTFARSVEDDAKLTNNSDNQIRCIGQRIYVRCKHSVSVNLSIITVDEIISDRADLCYRVGSIWCKLYINKANV